MKPAIELIFGSGLYFWNNINHYHWVLEIASKIKVKSIPITFESSNYGTNISFGTQLSKGVYFIKIALEDGRKAISRFVTE